MESQVLNPAGNTVRVPGSQGIQGSREEATRNNGIVRELVKEQVEVSLKGVRGATCQVPQIHR